MLVEKLHNFQLGNQWGPGTTRPAALSFLGPSGCSVGNYAISQWVWVLDLSQDLSEGGSLGVGKSCISHHSISTLILTLAMGYLHGLATLQSGTSVFILRGDSFCRQSMFGNMGH